MTVNQTFSEQRYRQDLLQKNHSYWLDYCLTCLFSVGCSSSPERLITITLALAKPCINRSSTWQYRMQSQTIFMHSWWAWQQHFRPPVELNSLYRRTINRHKRTQCYMNTSHIPCSIWVALPSMSQEYHLRQWSVFQSESALWCGARW